MGNITVVHEQVEKICLVRCHAQGEGILGAEQWAVVMSFYVFSLERPSHDEAPWPREGQE